MTTITHSCCYFTSILLVIIVLYSSCVVAETYPIGHGSDNMEYSISRHRVGPFNLFNQQTSFPVPLAPFPPEAAGIRYWGDWLCFDKAEGGNLIPQGKVFLHHIMLYGAVSGVNILVTGSSDERGTFGPDLFGDYVMSTQGTTVQGSVLLVGYLNKPTDVYIEYTLHWYTKQQMPAKPLYVLATYNAITIEVPMLGAGKIFNQTSPFVMPVSGYLVTGQGHLHVGGIASRLIEKETNTQVCNSYATHHTQEELPCFIECPTQCSNAPTTYPALKTIDRCVINKWYPMGTQFYMDIAYDAVCSFSGCHGQLYIWYAPAPPPTM